MRLRYAARSDVGLLRDGNEDSLYASPRLLAVADGMGGHAAGEVASAAVIRAVARLEGELDAAEDLPAVLRRAVSEANDAVRRLVAADPQLDGMGTTLTALTWDGRRVGLVHVGDSRAYRLHDGALEQLTHDHTFVQQMVDEGRISREEAGMHPQRSVITRALDGRADVEPDVDLREPVVGDRYLVCSDGLSGVVSDETLQETLATGSAEETADALLSLALRGGAPDNVSVIVADVVDDPADEQLTVIGGAAAGRAAEAADGPAEAEDSAASVGRRGHRRRRIPPAALAAIAVFVVVLAGAGGAYAWVSGQWYVGATKGGAPDAQVAIYHGVPGSVAGVALAQLHNQVALPVTALPSYEQVRVRQGINASSLSAARRIVTGLLQQVCTPAPAPAPSPALPTPTLTRQPALPAACSNGGAP